MKYGLQLLVLVFGLTVSSAGWAQTGIERFFGSYVGSGVAERVGGTGTEQRDMDVTFESYKDDGFTLKWITVVRGEQGERAGAGVRRREIEENFLRSDENPNLYILAPRGGLFQKAELPNPLKGEPMRWATIQNDTLSVYSLGITENGRSEMQIFHRTLTETGMDVSFVRLADENIELRVVGRLVRTD